MRRSTLRDLFRRMTPAAATAGWGQDGQGTPALGLPAPEVHRRLTRAFVAAS